MSRNPEVKTIYGVAVWYIRGPEGPDQGGNQYYLSVPDGFSPSICWLVRERRRVYKIIIRHLMGGYTTTTLSPSLSVAEAKTKAIELLVTAGIVDPVAYLAVVTV